MFDLLNKIYLLLKAGIAVIIGPITGAVSVTNFPVTQPVTGPLTDAQLRATAVPVSGPLTDAQLRATAVPVAGPLTDAQLRATAVPVAGPLTDAQLRATAVPENLTQWGAATVAAAIATGPTGNEVAPVFRAIPIRPAQSAAPAPGLLGGGAAYISQWYDTSLLGINYIIATAFADKPSAASSFLIQESEDQTNVRNCTASASANFAVGASVALNTLTSICGLIRLRYFRILYTNGAAAQTSFSLTFTGFYHPFGGASLTSGTSSGFGSPFIGIASLPTVGSIADGNAGSNLGGIGALTEKWNGATWDRIRHPNIFKPQNVVAINPEATIWTPAAGKKFRLMGGLVTSSVVGNIVLRDNTAGTIILIIPVGVAGVPIAFDLQNGILSAAANNLLTATGPALSTISGQPWGTEE